jgi:hypothetical protein
MLHIARRCSGVRGDAGSPALSWERDRLALEARIDQMHCTATGAIAWSRAVV